jgi:predicted lysophospholipase L1 biosynthesis ABC-type transport system permease subunit
LGRAADERGGIARERAPAARQSGALAIPVAPARGGFERQRAGHARKAGRAQFPNAGWDIRTRNKASPQLERNVERFSQFLTLVALTALLVGGVGVANAVASHLARKRDAIATMKALGATGGGVFAIYCAQIMLVALFATCIGAGLVPHCRS